MGNILSEASPATAQEWESRSKEVEALLIELANTKEELVALGPVDKLQGWVVTLKKSLDDLDGQSQRKDILEILLVRRSDKVLEVQKVCDDRITLEEKLAQVIAREGALVKDLEDEDAFRNRIRPEEAYCNTWP